MQYKREKNGRRFVISGGMVLTKPLDLLGEGEYGYLQNVRARLAGRILGRPTTDAPIFTLPNAPQTIVRMNDTTPSGPPAGYVRVTETSAGDLFVNATGVASGFTGNPMAILPFGPDQSVQPWAYTGDSSQAVVITSTGQSCTGMVKVRSDGLTRKTGIKEPQSAPLVGINTVAVTQYLTLPADTPPWTNIGGANPDHNYNGTDTQPPYPAIIATPVAGATVALTVTGTATVNGASHAPGDSGPSAPDYPGDFIASPLIVVFAFTDASGNILAQSTKVGAPPVVGNVGASATVTVPANAAQLQIGINSQGGTFAANSGSYLIQAVVSTSAITEAVSIVGDITAYIWGDSPHSGPVASYIWKNPNDGGPGIARTSGTAQAKATNNSLHFDSSPEDGTVPVQWATYDSSGSNIGNLNLFDPALESAGYQDFNVCVVGSFFIPEAGTYAVEIQNKDQIMFGVGGGATSDSDQTSGPVYGQKISVIDALPLMYVSTPDGEGTHVTNTINVTFPALGVYPFEVDWDYWYHTGRSLIVRMSPTPGDPVKLIPPQPPGTRTNVEYWNKYRASETGAQSNPGPNSPNQVTPVLANTVTSPFSTDPQVDKVDYYRQDDGLANPTYIGTGPNDGLGGTINGILYNTAIEDALSDIAAAGNQLMQTDDFEPFPSIDVPKAGMVTIIGGVINWVSGDKFDIRWLPGTIIQIGTPTQTAYVLVARPISDTQMVIPTVPDTIGDVTGAGVPYNIAQPILAQQPLPSMWGPDAYGFMHGCGDPNQPGAYVWTKAYNPDSAPQTNRLILTSPSEVLMGGSLVNGISMVFSTLRAWLMYPNFANAQATTEGTLGTPWSPILAVVTRGLYIRNCLCSLGGKAIAFRAPDGISITTGSGEKSITDDQIYPLFPHENFTPVPVEVGPYTVYPPNDNLPQSLTFQNGYIYWDYIGSNSAPQTLVYDEMAKGWSVDVGDPAFTAHAQDYAPGLSDTVVGCSDGSVRVLQSGGSESATSVVATGADNSGESRALKRISDVYVRAIVQTGKDITVGLFSGQYAHDISAEFNNTTLVGSGGLGDYIVDPGDHEPQDVKDLACTFSWATNGGNELDLWQPGFLDLPISILSRVTEGLTHGMLGYQHVYLVNLNYVATAEITLTLNTDEGTFEQTWDPGGSLFVPVKVMKKIPRNKWKVCAWQLTSPEPFYLFGCEAWVGAWGRAGEYVKLNPFNSPSNEGALSG